MSRGVLRFLKFRSNSSECHREAVVDQRAGASEGLDSIPLQRNVRGVDLRFRHHLVGVNDDVRLEVQGK